MNTLQLTDAELAALHDLLVKEKRQQDAGGFYAGHFEKHSPLQPVLRKAAELIVGLR